MPDAHHDEADDVEDAGQDGGQAGPGLMCPSGTSSARTVWNQ